MEFTYHFAVVLERNVFVVTTTRLQQVILFYKILSIFKQKNTLTKVQRVVRLKTDGSLILTVES